MMHISRSVEALYAQESIHTIRDCLRIVQENAERVALVMSGDILVGTITDGDIRRALLAGYTLEDTCSGICNREYKRVSNKESELVSVSRVILVTEGINQLPIVDEECRIKGLISRMPMRGSDYRAVIMAGGKGTRLRPWTEDCPKPMLPVGGKPMIDHLISNLRDCGFRHVYVSVNYLKEKIIDHLGDGHKYGVNIEYLEEERELGTGGSLQLLDDAISDILVVNGDVVSDVDYAAIMDFHLENEAFATMGVSIHKTQIPYGVVNIVNDTVTGITEKPTMTNFINAGIYVISRGVLDNLEEDESIDLPSLIMRSSKDLDRDVSVFPIHEFWLDAGDPKTLDAARRYHTV